MNERHSNAARRAGRRLLAGIALGAAALFAASPPASAAVTATFTANAGILTVFGDSLDNTIVISRDAAGKILVNGGAVSVSGGTATVANTALIQVFGQGGNDQLSFNEANGALPAGTLFGGAGNDVLTGGSGADLIFGQAGNDTQLGKGGNDLLFGGADNDTLTGGDGDDQAFGESGIDRMIWNPGDDTDLNEGGDGGDTVEVNGGNGAEAFTVSPNGTRVRFDRTTPAPFTLDIGTSENLVLDANGGDDSFSATGNMAALMKVTVDGGTGSDTLLGGNGADVLLGGDGNDLVDGNQGDDTASLGAGDDAFQWDPGDGSDTVEGQDGSDTLAFNGGNLSETFDLAANGGRLRFARNIGNIVMDTNDVEVVDLKTLGGFDTVTENDLSGTDVTSVKADLGGGDNAADTAIVKGTPANDRISASGDVVTGIAATMHVTGGEQANDRILVDALDGADTVDALGSDGNDVLAVAPAPILGQVRVTGTGLPVDTTATETLDVDGRGGDDSVTGSTGLAALVSLVLEGEAGNDALIGGDGADVLLAGDGDDVVVGRQGNDFALLGAGDDAFQWNPGDGNDTVEGQDGTDGLAFNGAEINENIDISANGSRVLLVRNVASVAMDFDGIESIDTETKGGVDRLVVNDLSGTDVATVIAGLATPAGGDDGAADNVVVNATNGDDVVSVSGNAGGLEVDGLAAQVLVTGGFPPNDRLTINALAGDDAVVASSVAAGAMLLTLDGGDGDDVLIGGAGNDTLLGGAGDDVLIGGPGIDILDGGPGSNVVLAGLVSDTVSSATVAGTDWLQKHAHASNGKTVFDIGGKERTLPNVDLTQLAADVSAS
jgi:Ca2+-binding RTX toxin-like protein